jgi:WD40 repeat protein
MKFVTIHFLAFLALSFLILEDSSSMVLGQESANLTIEKVLDLNHDGVNVIAFSSASRELFVAHEFEGGKLFQWNIAQKRLVHKYTCPADYVRWDEATISPHGKLLVAALFPAVSSIKAQVLFIDTQSHQIRFSAKYDHGAVGKIRFEGSGKYVQILMNDLDSFVYDDHGKEHGKRNKKFEAESRDRLWDVPQSQGGPPSGLFFKDTRGGIHRLVDNPLNQNFAFSKDAKYIGTSTFDQRLRIWRTSDLHEVFNKKVGGHPVRLVYDAKDDQFLVLDGIDGETHLRTVRLPR